MSNTLPEVNAIIKGEVDYYFPDLARDVRTYTDEMLQPMKKKYNKDDMYKVALMIVMLSAEEKTVTEITQALGQKEEFVTLGQELLAEFIEIGRGVHMGMFLDIMEKYSSSTHMTITLLNIEIKKFLHKEMQLEDEHNI